MKIWISHTYFDKAFVDKLMEILREQCGGDFVGQGDFVGVRHRVGVGGGLGRASNSPHFFCTGCRPYRAFFLVASIHRALPYATECRPFRARRCANTKLKYYSNLT